MNRTKELCEFLAGLDPEMVDPENMLDIRYKTLDWLGCIIAAQGHSCVAGLRATITAAGGNPQASGAGMPEKTSAQQAAFYNGFASHALEYDDTNKIAITHPGGPVIAAALAAAEARGATFQSYAMGVAAGYEAMIRLGGAINPDHYQHWHTTGTCGVFAAAAAVCKIMGLDARQMETAFGLASTMASGLIYVFGTDAKLVTVGNAARNGLLAAELAAGGLSAPEDAFAAPGGYARSAGGKEDLSFMVPRAGDRLLLEDAYYKIHASCGHTHSALDALQALMAGRSFGPEDVASVEAQVYRTALQLCGGYRTETESKAKFSLPYCIAVMLLYGRCTLSEFTPEIRCSDAVAQYARRITVKENEAYTAAYPALRMEKITVVLRDGSALERTVDLPLGRPPYQFLEEKFFSLAELTVTPACAQNIRDSVFAIRDDEPLLNIGNQIRNLRRN
ncbi:MAG: MmgE/PrpD family protein [Clostridiales bacterium]